MAISPDLLVPALQALQRGDVQEALKLCEQLAADHPGDPRVLLEWGRTLSTAGNQQEARARFGEILKQRPRNGDTHYALAMTFQIEGDMQQTEEILDHGLVHRPAHPMLLGGKARCLNARGEFTDAHALLSPLVEQGQTPFPVLKSFVDACEGCGRDDEALRMLRLAVDTQPMAPAQRMVCQFALGRLSEGGGEFDAAFKAYNQANGLYPGRFDAAAYSAAIDHAIDSWDERTFAELPRSGSDLEVPVFIVGMPRSGVALVERLLAAHAGVVAAGPLQSVATLANRVYLGSAAQGDGFSLEGVTTESVEMASNEYIIDLVDLAPSAERVTDANPFNFLHLGFIALMFPQARIVHCARDPLDTCFSCFAHHFSTQVDFAYDLDNIGAFHSDYTRLMKHYTGLLEHVHEVRYESLCTETEATVRSLLDHLGLEFDDACLDIDVTTDRIGRHRSFDEHLGPLRTALGLP